MIQTWSQKVSKNDDLQTDTNSPRTKRFQIELLFWQHQDLQFRVFIFAKHQAGRNRSWSAEFGHFAKLTKYKNKKIFSSCLSYIAERKEYKNTKIKHVFSCFSKLTNTKHCFEMFPFEVLQTFFKCCSFSSIFIPFIRISYDFLCLRLWSVFVPFVWVSYVFLEFLTFKKIQLPKKYTSANQKRCLKFTAKITMPNYTLFECTVFMYIMQ